MDNQHFRMPMVICAGSPRKFSLVSTVADASSFLLDHRSKNDSSQWTDAINQCVGAAVGAIGVADAGSSFVMALRSAGINVDTTVLLY